MKRIDCCFQMLRELIANGYVRGEVRARVAIDEYLSGAEEYRSSAVESLRRELTPYLKNTTAAQAEFVASLLRYVNDRSRRSRR